MDLTSPESTQLLEAAAAGDQRAVDRLLPLVYEQLKGVAGRLLSGGPAGTLQATALVNEAYFKLLGNRTTDFNDSAHFMAIAARAMRQVLIDHARGKGRQKRGGDQQRVPLSDSAAMTDHGEVDGLALVEALERLSKRDERAARVVEMKFFAEMTEAQIGDVLDVSRRTVRDDWKFARAFLRRELGQAGPGSPDGG